jgi:hypothetical protein
VKILILAAGVHQEVMVNLTIILPLILVWTFNCGDMFISIEQSISELGSIKSFQQMTMLGNKVQFIL